jgi:hypothetical protein
LQIFLKLKNYRRFFYQKDYSKFYEIQKL